MLLRCMDRCAWHRSHLGRCSAHPFLMRWWWVVAQAASSKPRIKVRDTISNGTLRRSLQPTGPARFDSGSRCMVAGGLGGPPKPCSRVIALGEASGEDGRRCAARSYGSRAGPAMPVKERRGAPARRGSRTSRRARKGCCTQSWVARDRISLIRMGRWESACVGGAPAVP